MDKSKQCNGTKVNPLIKFAQDIIEGMGGLHDYERYEMAIEKYDHDVCVAIWTLKCLANPHNELSETVLNLVNERFNDLKKENV